MPTPAPVGVRRRPGRARRADARHPDHPDRWSTTSTTRYPREDRAWDAADTLKNVVVVLRHPDGTREPLAIGVPGDREVDLKRLDAQVYPAEIEAFDEKDFAAHPTLAKGYIGPGVLGEKNASGIRYLVDPRVVEGTRWVTGADVAGSHVIDLVAGRDFTADGTIEAAEVREGDPCPDGDGTLHTARGIEMGHIFALGRKFADALDLKVLDENGKLVTVTMGSYGIGASRAVAAVAEGTLDEVGLCWPREVAPADVHLVAAGKDEHVLATAERIAHELSAAGIDVLFDDRLGKVSPGVKFKDAELIGVPTIVVVGKDLATDGSIEVKDRALGRQRAGRRRPRGRPRREARACLTPDGGIDAVIFDWGGTLTRWHDVDFHAESLALAQAVIDVDHDVHVSQAPLARGQRDGLGPVARPPAERDGRGPVRRGRARPRPRAAHGLLRVLGATHAHRPRGRTALGVAPQRGDQGRRPLQHDLAARLARGLLPP